MKILHITVMDVETGENDSFRARKATFDILLGNSEV